MYMYYMTQDSLEDKMASHSSILTLKIPWTEQPGGLQSTETQGRIQLNN